MRVGQIFPLLMLATFCFVGCGSNNGGPCEGEECLSDCEDGSCENGEICLTSGKCCPVARANGDECCPEGDIVFAGRCVTPGDTCQDTSECEANEYCETSLGDSTPNPDPMCTSVETGQCLSLPPACGNGVTENCIKAECEVVREARPLEAEIDWQWPAAGQAAREYPSDIETWNTPVTGRLADTNCDGVVDELDPASVVFMSGHTNNNQCAGVGTCKDTILRVLNGKTGEEVWSKRGPSDAPGSADNDTNGMGELPNGSPCSAGTPDCNLEADEIGEWAGMSPAIGDVDHDGVMEILAISETGHVVLVGHDGVTLAISDEPVDGPNGNAWDDPSRGWGGGLALADMNGDGVVEVAFGAQLYEITKSGGNFAVTQKWESGSWGGGSAQTALAYFADIDLDGQQELIAGTRVFEYDCVINNNACQFVNTGLTTNRDGFSAIANLDMDPEPELVYVGARTVRVYDVTTTPTLQLEEVATIQGIATTGSGGPPTIANFSNLDNMGNVIPGDTQVEIGVAFFQYYEVFRPTLDGNGKVNGLTRLWHKASHDLSSSVTGSTVFDFEGDGIAEVVYNDECYLWVYDGRDGAWRFATQTTSFTGTEASLVADVDSDGSAEILMIGNSANPLGWDCYGPNSQDGKDWGSADEPDPTPGSTYVRPRWVGPNATFDANGNVIDPDQTPDSSYRGLWAFRARNNGWVGTRSIWNQHSYSVSNICGDKVDACPPGSTYGDIPATVTNNWDVSYLNNFRQNIQGEGALNAPDPQVNVTFSCQNALFGLISVSNVGRSPLPIGVELGLFRLMPDNSEVQIGTTQVTDRLIYPGGAIEYSISLPPEAVSENWVIVGRILGDATTQTFVECDDQNNRAEANITCGIPL